MRSRNAAMVFVTGLIWAMVPALAQTTSTSSSWLPPAGIASTETIQVNVVNNARAAASALAASCTGTIAFYNTGGSIIGTAASFTIGDGEIFSATVPFGSTGASGPRTVVQAKITLTGSATGENSSARCVLASSLEIFDTASGVTHAFIAGATQLPVAALRTGVFSPVPR